MQIPFMRDTHRFEAHYRSGDDETNWTLPSSIFTTHQPATVPIEGSGQHEPPSSGLIGNSSALRQTLSQIDMVAPTDAPVLLLGETGNGKELIAQEVHRRSRRKSGPLIRVNCACVPKELFESEFFGHVKGAFTGAIKDRIGRFEAAEGGTLFLDEIREIP